MTNAINASSLSLALSPSKCSLHSTLSVLCCGHLAHSPASTARLSLALFRSRRQAAQLAVTCSRRTASAERKFLINFWRQFVRALALSPFLSHSLPIAVSHCCSLCYSLCQLPLPPLALFSLCCPVNNCGFVAATAARATNFAIPCVCVCV